MPYPIKLKGATATTASYSPVTTNSLRVHPLTDEHETEVLAFLAAGSVPTALMTSLIRDNGLESPCNRGTFYACRDTKGRLRGVALIGHATLIEAHTKTAFEAFVRFVQVCPHKHVIMGEQEEIMRFWSYYAQRKKAPVRLCRELLFEQQWPIAACQEVPGLRHATLDDLALVMAVNAEMAFKESGVNPLETDPCGFRLRCARRIEQERVWVWVERKKLIFKADILADTPEVIYLEGVYTHPEERGKGYGLRCMSQLGRHLLARTKSLCLLVNERHREVQTFFQRAGYKQRGCYDTIFLQQQSEEGCNQPKGRNRRYE